MAKEPEGCYNEGSGETGRICGMPEQIRLRRSYIQVRRKNGDVTFGGDQGFFRAGGGREDARKAAAGCGIVAFSDLLLYLSGKDEAYRIKQNADLADRILDETQYKRYYDTLYSSFGGIAWKGGVSGLKLSREFNRTARKNGWKLRAVWGLDGNKIFDRMERMLESDIPVILCIPMMLRKGERNDRLWLYEKEEAETKYRRAQAVNAHYVTVTGMIRDEKAYLEISSWGRKFYICREEYDVFIHTHFMGTILGNILYVRQKFENTEVHTE